MILLEDSNNKVDKHQKKNRYWEEHGIQVIRQRLPVGDYVLMNEKMADVIRRKTERGIKVKMMDLVGTYDVCVDEKSSIAELCQDVCGKDHNRFRDELIFAQNNGIKLHILVENDLDPINIKKKVVNTVIYKLEDLHRWTNPRLWIMEKGKQKYPRATKGSSLMKACMTLQKKYGCEFHFTSSRKAGAEVLRLLGVPFK